jgi:uncharacterized metal-binding protein YceD (DUF177 family)
MQKSCTFATIFRQKKTLGRFEAYLVDFRNIAQAEVRTYEYLLENKFFIDIDGPEVQKGKVKINLKVEAKPSFFELSFQLAGVVYVSCDRCLDDVEIPVETNNRLIVKLGKEYAEESDEVLIIAEDDSTLNLAWFLYEFVALSVPMKHVHPPGKCNKTMTSKLKKHSAKRPDDEDPDDFTGDDELLPADDEPESTDTDPRWDTLKELL